MADAPRQGMSRLRIFGLVGGLVALLGGGACSSVAAGGTVNPAYPVTGPPSGGPERTSKIWSFTGSVSDVACADPRPAAERLA
jgi:hypothetical protein